MQWKFGEQREYFISAGDSFIYKMFANNQSEQTYSYNSKCMNKIIHIRVDLMPKKRKRLSIASGVS